MPESVSALFRGLPVEELEPWLSRLERQQFPAGAVVLAQGESNRGVIYVIASGSVDVLISGREGDHFIARRGPGDTLGEMSFITGEPASATVRAADELTVLVFNEVDFTRLAAAFPQVYQNISAILAERLASATRRFLAEPHGAITVLRDEGAPPLLGYALACSVAWHTRRPTLLVVIVAGPLATELAALGESAPGPRIAQSREGGVGAFPIAAGEVPGRGAEGRAHLTLLATGDELPAPRLEATLAELTRDYDHVLVQIAGGNTPSLQRAGAVRLLGPHASRPEHTGDRPRFTLRAWADGAGLARPDAEGVLHVPALSPEDEAGLRRGVLPSATSAGRALGWAARDLAGLKVGLALGSGIRGFAHLGVLRVLERAGVRPDYICGTSMGAIMGTACAAGFTLDEIERLIDRHVEGLIRPTVPVFSFLSNSRLRDLFRRLGGELLIEEMRIPLAVVAADILSRREIVFRRGLAWRALMASTAIPGIFPPHRMGPYVLVDGAVLNPVPCRVAAEMGAGVVIGVRLDDPLSSRGEPMGGPETEDSRPTSHQPRILQVILRSIEMMESQISAEAAATATLLIQPCFEDTVRPGVRNFVEGRPHLAVGEAAAEAALPRLASLLPWLRG
jgi:NTE family protein